MREDFDENLLGNFADLRPSIYSLLDTEKELVCVVHHFGELAREKRDWWREERGRNLGNTSLELVSLWKRQHSDYYSPKSALCLLCHVDSLPCRKTTAYRLIDRPSLRVCVFRSGCVGRHSCAESEGRVVTWTLGTYNALY